MHFQMTPTHSVPVVLVEGTAAAAAVAIEDAVHPLIAVVERVE